MSATDLEDTVAKFKELNIEQLQYFSDAQADVASKLVSIRGI